MLVVLALSVCSCAPRTGILADRCTLRVGTSGDYAPFSVRSADQEHGPNERGLDISIAANLGSDLGCHVDFVPFAWPTLLDQLERGDFDIALSGITMRPERALRARFSRPYARTGVVILTRTLADLRSLADLDRGTVRLAVNRGGHLEKWTRANLPNATVRTVRDNQSLPEILEAARVDAVVTDSAEARAWSLPATALGPFSTDYKAVLIHSRRPDLAERIDRWLVAHEADGTLEQMRSRALGDSQGDAIAATQHSIAALARLRLSLMPLVAAAKAATGKTVTDGAQEGRVIDRARAWSSRDRPVINHVFRALIELAKKIQRRTQSKAPAPTLDALRTAIKQTDRQIVRELDRLPQTPVEQWHHILAPLTHDLPLETVDLDDLAVALAAQKTAASPSDAQPVQP